MAVAQRPVMNSVTASGRSAVRHLFTATLATVLAAIPAIARGQEAAIASAPLDAGWRAYGAIGSPTILGLGLGYKLGRVELLVNAGGFSYIHVHVGVLEANAHVDLRRWANGSAYAGVAWSLIHEPQAERSCDGKEPSCDDDETTSVTHTWVGPRVGARAILSPDTGLLGPTYLDVSAGPMVGTCRSGCTDEGARLRFAGVVRLVVQF
jgi:hypothetical protein